jgi:hypothetical protein
VRTNWYSALQDLVLSKVFWGQMIDSSTIDVATGRVEIDMCMTRWRDFYHRTSMDWAWRWTHAPPRQMESDYGCTYHAWFAYGCTYHAWFTH